jgi:O-antigen/teichoic acid export membrane protein
MTLRLRPQNARAPQTRRHPAAISEAVPATALRERKPPPAEPAQAPARPPLSSVVARLAAANLALTAVTLLTAPLQARVLGPAGRGELAAILVPLGLAPIVLSLGLGTYAFRATAVGARVGTLIGTIGTLLVLLGVLGAAAGTLVAEFVGNGRPVVETWVMVGFALLPVGLLNIFLADIAGGLERWGTVVAVRLVLPAALLVGIGGLYITGELTVASAAVVAIVGGTLPALFLIPGIREFRPLRFDGAIAKEAIPFGLKAWAAGLGSLVNVRVDQLLMTRMVDSSELGLYVIAVATAGILVTPLATGLAGGTMPRFATGSIDLVAGVLRATLLGVLVISIGVALGAPVLVPLVFGSEFAEAVPMVWVLLLAGFPLAGTVVLSTAIVSCGRPGYAAWAELLALGITVPGLFLLLPHFGGVGAALVSLLAYVASFAMLTVIARRQLGARVYDLFVIRPADAAALVRMIRSRFPDRLSPKSWGGS